MSPAETHKEFYNLDEIAKMLGISRALARKLFPVIKLGRRVTVRRTDLNAVIAGGLK